MKIEDIEYIKYMMWYIKY